MTKSELIAQCKAENPKMFSIINGEEIELLGAEYEAACEAWAQMRLEQLEAEAKVENQILAKKALLERLGITQDEAALLFAKIEEINLNEQNGTIS